jgi:hypothetical protein
MTALCYYVAELAIDRLSVTTHPCQQERNCKQSAAENNDFEEENEIGARSTMCGRKREQKEFDSSWIFLVATAVIYRPFPFRSVKEQPHPRKRTRWKSRN